MSLFLGVLLSFAIGNVLVAGAYLWATRGRGRVGPRLSERYERYVCSATDTEIHVEAGKAVVCRINGEDLDPADPVAVTYLAKCRADLETSMKQVGLDLAAQREIFDERMAEIFKDGK